MPIEIFDLTRNLGIVSGRIEPGDAPDAGLPRAERLPGFVHTGAERSDQAQAGHDNPSCRSIRHNRTVNQDFSLM